MFRGISNLNIDVKGRVAIPARYRDSITANASGEMVITVDHTDRCLLLYPMDQWLKVEQVLMGLPNMNRSVRNMQRLVLGHASEVELDSQGRVRLSLPLREYANLQKKSVLIGQANKFELWGVDTWNMQRDEWLAEAQGNLETDDVLSQISL
ncbi:MAG: division/cell wall cluster transcriptional repressor MraZ [Cocleimonas sp.]|nr:division/cell wall cluster transcriptional repressor MraZ [Cocleimonas sp.]